MEMSQIDKTMGRFKTFAEYVKLRELGEPAAPDMDAAPMAVPSKAKRGVARAINNMPSDSAVDVIQASTTGNLKQNPAAVKTVVSKSLARNSVNNLGDVTSVLGLNKKPV
jgi:hypothetical protein